jgi:NDP-sugar pyrophosphorylase family protein
MSMMWKQKSREIKDAVLLVAGTGSRLRPLTNNLPKCLIEIAGTPLIVRLLRQLKEHGIERARAPSGHSRSS